MLLRLPSELASVLHRYGKFSILRMGGTWHRSRTTMTTRGGTLPVPSPWTAEVGDGGDSSMTSEPESGLGSTTIMPGALSPAKNAADDDDNEFSLTFPSPSPSLADVASAEAAAILAGLIAGGRYGVKIRLPHAFVMTFLFRGDLTLREKVIATLRLTLTHAWSLAKFAGLYKTVLALLKISSRRLECGGSRPRDRTEIGTMRWCATNLLRLMFTGRCGNDPQEVPSNPKSAGLPERPFHSFIAGAVGGYAIWGEYNSVHYQIVLYLASRVLVGCAKLTLRNCCLLGPKLGTPSARTKWRDLADRSSFPIAASLVWAAVMMLFEECPDVLHPSLKKSMDEIYRRGVKTLQRSPMQRRSDTSTLSNATSWLWET